MKTSFFRFAAILLFASVLAAGCDGRAGNMRLLYWNIQNGMWSDQGSDYDNFVAWVREYDPDICVWCEAQSIYKSGTADKMAPEERYLTENWGELAARYGHRYWYVGGHRDDYPQVVTSNRRPGAREHRFPRGRLGTNHEKRQDGQYRDAPHLAAGVRIPCGRPRGQPGRTRRG